MVFRFCYRVFSILWLVFVLGGFDPSFFVPFLRGDDWHFSCDSQALLDDAQARIRQFMMEGYQDAFAAIEGFDGPDELTYYQKSMSPTRKVTPCVEPSMEGDTFDGSRCERSLAELIDVFHSEAFLSGYLKEGLDWRTPQASLSSLSTLEDLIQHNYYFRRDQVRPLEEAFGKGFVDNLIADRRQEIFKEIRLEKKRKEDLWEEFLEEDSLHEGREEDMRSHFRSSSGVDGGSVMQGCAFFERCHEELVNFEEMLSALEGYFRGRFAGDRCSELLRVGRVELKKCFCDLEDGDSKRYFVRRRRIRSIIEELQRVQRNPSWKVGPDGGKRFTCELSDNLLDRLRSYELPLGEIKGAECNGVQEVIFGEAVEILNANADHMSIFGRVSNLHDMSNLVAHSAGAALECGLDHEYGGGYRFLDFAASVFDVVRGGGRVLYSVFKGSAKGCFHAATFPVVLGYDLIRAPVETVFDLAEGVYSIVDCFVRGVYDSLALSGGDFDASVTGQRLKSFLGGMNKLSFDEKIEAGAELLTEFMFFPVASRLKLVDRGKRLTASLKRVLGRERSVRRFLPAKKASLLVRRAGLPLTTAVEESLFGFRRYFAAPLEKVMVQVEDSLVRRVQSAVRFDGSVTRQDILAEVRRAIRDLRSVKAKGVLDFQRESVLRGPFSKGSKISVRADIGSRAHKYRKYVKPVDHFNFDLFDGNSKVIKFHIIVDKDFSVLDFFEKKFYLKS